MGQLIDIEGGVLCYEVHDSYRRFVGPVEDLVLIHGTGMDRRYWYKIIPLLQQHYRVISYDLRGHGESRVDSDVTNWNLLIQDLQALMERVGLDRFHVVGHGMGANLATVFQMRYPEHFLSMTLISSTIYYPPRGASEVIRNRKLINGESSLAAIADYLVPRILMNPVDNPDASLLYDSYKLVSVKLYFNFLENLLTGMPDLEQISKMTLPVLILTGEFDPIYPPRLTGLSAFTLPNNRYVVVPNAANAIFLDQPEFTAKSILQFIRGEGGISKDKRPDVYTDSFLEELGSHINHFLVSGLGSVLSDRPSHFLQVELLNTFIVRLNGRELTEGWNQRYAKSLFCYLLFHRSVTREQICDELFPELDYLTAKKNLRVYVHHLRKLLNTEEHEFLKSDNEHVFLTGNIDCDLVKYYYDLEEVSRLEGDGGAGEVGEHYEAYSVVLRDTPKVIMPGIFDEWALKLVTEVQRKLIKVCTTIARYHADRREYTKAVDYLERVMEYPVVEDDLFDWIIRLCELAQSHQRKVYWQEKREAVYG